MQCKDILDAPILEFLGRLEREEVAAKDGARTWFPRMGIIYAGFPQSVQVGFPEEALGKPKLVRAKMAKLINSGFISGCACGCRGDFQLTDKGRALIARNRKMRAAPSTIAEQVADAQAEVATWPDGKLARVKLAGGDQP